MCALPGSMYEADDHIGFVFRNHRWVGWSDDELAAVGVHEKDYGRFRHTKASNLRHAVREHQKSAGRELV